MVNGTLAAGQRSRPEAQTEATGESWGAALLKAGLVLVGCFLGFVFLPQRLLTYLATRVTPNVRDGLVTLFDAVVFVLLAWALLALQRRGTGGGRG